MPALRRKGTAKPRTSVAQSIADALARDRRRFLRFVTAKLGDAEHAEELLQGAYLKSVEKAGALRDGESAVAWFYRVLRNAIVDQHRHRQRNSRLSSRYAAPTQTESEPLRGVACQCVTALLPALRPDYANALRRIDLEDATVPQLATELGISANNAGVRLHRARQALRKQVQLVCGTCATHGCLDCECSRRQT